MTETIAKIELSTEESRATPVILSVSVAGLTGDVAVTFHLLLPPMKADEIERLYLTEPAPGVELAMELSPLNYWKALGKIRSIQRHSLSSDGNVVCDVTFEPDDKSNIVKLRILQSR